MNITIFNKKYWVRRFGTPQIIDGYTYATHSDFVASLNVHPGSDNIQTQEAGERDVMRLEAHGADVLRSANHDSGVKGDLLFYHGRWYECVSATEWDHTILSHWNYSFMAVPLDAAGTPDLAPPDGDPT